MIDETPLAKACQGLRGQKYDREEIVQTLLSLSRLVQEHPGIVEVDINPLMLYGDGRRQRRWMPWSYGSKSKSHSYKKGAK